ncbi:MAG: FtsX-like permease family protein [Pseudomonadota bacterium]
MNSAELIFSNIRHAWLRNMLLMLSVLIAYVLFGVLMAFEHAYNSGSGMNSGRIITANKTSFTQPLPISHFTAAQTVEGIEAASFAAWFGGHYREPRHRLHTLAIDPPSYLEVYGDDLKLTHQERSRFLNERGSALVGASMAEKFGWQVGDQIPIINTQIARADGVETWSFTIAGLVKGATAYVDTSFLYIHYDLLNETRASGKNTIGWIVSKPASGIDTGTLGARIDRLFDTSAERTTTDSERSFAQTFVAQFGDLALATLLVLGAAFVSLLMIVGSTTALAIQRRIREIGILKSIGFSHPRVFMLLIGESVLVITIAGLIGLALASLFAAASAEHMMAIAPGMTVSVEIVVMALASMIVLAIAASVLPAWRAVSASTSSVLRRG